MSVSSPSKKISFSVYTFALREEVPYGSDTVNEVGSPETLPVVFSTLGISVTLTYVPSAVT